MTEFNPFAIFVLVCGAMTVAIAYYAWRHRTAFGARPFSLFMLALSVYIIGYSMELASTDLASMLFWSKVEYFGILSFPALYLVFASEYTDQDNKQTPRMIFLLFAIPAVLWFFKIFDETFHLIYATARVDASGAIPAAGVHARAVVPGGIGVQHHPADAGELSSCWRNGALDPRSTAGRRP